MRGFRSTFILLRRAGRAGRLHLLLRDEAAGAGRHGRAEAEGVHRRGRHDRGDRGEGRRRASARCSGRPATPGASPSRSTAKADETRGHRHRHQPRVARDPARRRRERRPTSRSSAWRRRASRWPSRQAGQKDASRLLHRRQDTRPAASCTRKLPARSASSWSSSFLETTFNRGHLRPARQDGPGVRPRQGRRARDRHRRTSGSRSRRRATQWALTSPVAARADQGQVEGADRQPADAAR